MFWTNLAATLLTAAPWPDKMTAIGTFVLALAAVLALASLGHARRARHAEIILDLSRRWDEELATKSREAGSNYDSAGLVKLIDSVYEPPPAASADERREHVRRVFDLLLSLNVMETIGVLYADGAISCNAIFSLWGPGIVETWDRWRPAILKMREYEKRRGIFQPLELLARDLREYLDAERRGG